MAANGSRHRRELTGEHRQPDLFSKRRRGRKPPPALETATQIAIADLLRIACRKDWYWTKIEHGLLRAPKTAALAQRLGVKPGLFDFLLFGPPGNSLTYWLELKRGRLGTMSEAQKKFENLLQERAIPHAICRSYDEAKRQLEAWGALRASL